MIPPFKTKNRMKYKRNDFVTYIGGIKSKYLTNGQRYRLTCSPFRNRIAIINDNGIRMVKQIKHFRL